MKKAQLNVEVLETIKKKAKRLAKKYDLPLRLFITKLIKEAQ